MVVDKAVIIMVTALHVQIKTVRHAPNSGHSAMTAKMGMSQTAMASVKHMIHVAMEKVWTIKATALHVQMTTAASAPLCGLNAPSVILDTA